MSREFPYPMHQHDARVIAGDPQANAYAWILAYADQISGEPSEDPDDDDNYGYGSTITADELISVAFQRIDEPNGWHYLSKGGLLEGTGTDPMFWEKLAILYKIEVDPDVAGNFFSCSC